MLRAAAALAGAILLCAAPPSTPAWGITYLTQDEALALAFPEGTALTKKTFQLREDGQRRYREELGTTPPPGTLYEVYMGVKDGTPQGWAFVLTESSRYRPITFLVAIAPGGTVGRVEVMVYREPRGEQVKEGRYLKQYERQSGAVELGKEIQSISGATVSGQVITFGVNKALFLVRELLLQDNAAQTTTTKAAP